jgi:hypothetical protein
MIPKSVQRFSERIMLKQHDPEKLQTFRITSCDQTKILGAKSRFNLNGCRSKAVGRTLKFAPAWNAGCSTEFSRSDRTNGRPAG